MSTATTFSSMLHSVARAMNLAAHRVDLGRLSAHDLADLNLPPEFRSRIDLGREAMDRGRLGGSLT